jgi:fermentation-respiration switch protein FrsA (DUF1100 family)
MDAAVTGTGWEGIDPQVRATADTPWFRSLLTFDPAAVMKKVKQPLLLVRADGDVRVPMHHADKLAALANIRKKAAPTSIVTLDGAGYMPGAAGPVAAFLKQALGLR